MRRRNTFSPEAQISRIDQSAWDQIEQVLDSLPLIQALFDSGLLSGTINADTVNEFTAANGVSVDGVAFLDGAVTGTSFNGVALTAGGAADQFLAADGTYKAVGTTIGGMTDVTLTALATDDLLLWNGAAWVNVAKTTVGVTDHTGLTNIGTNTHAQIDTHIADATVHFTQASISITESQISDLQAYITGPAGTDNQVQVNEAGVFDGSSNLLFDKATSTLTVGDAAAGIITSNTAQLLYLRSGGSGVSSAGIINIEGGDSTFGAGEGGHINLVGGGSIGIAQTAGNINLTAGDGVAGPGGDIILTPGVGSILGYVGIMPTTSHTDGAELRFFEQAVNGSHSVIVKAQASLLGDRVFFLPSGLATEGYVLTAQADGSSEWEASPIVFKEDANVNMWGGLSAGLNLTSGAANNFLAGAQAGLSLTTGDDNICIGYLSNQNSQTANRAIAIGRESLKGVNTARLTGLHNTAVGYRAFMNLRGASADNTAVGTLSGSSINVDGANDNALFGYRALPSCPSGSENTVIGANAGNNINAASSGLILLGQNAGPSTIGGISNELYINNAITDTPLIHGYFSAHASGPAITVNGEFTSTGALATLGNFIFDADQVVGVGQDNYVLTYDNVTGHISLEAATGGGGGINNVVEDTTPQLGGNLDVQTFSVTTSAVNGSIALTPNGTGDVVLGTMTFDADQTIGVGQDNYVLTYDNATSKISLEAAAAGGISNVVEDTTPQLGGDLDVNGSDIVATTGPMEFRNTFPDGAIEFYADNTSSIARRMLRIGPTGSNSVELGLYWNSNLRLLTTNPGITITGGIITDDGVDKLTTATGSVSVAAAAAPSIGQVLTATSATTATWQDAAGGSVLSEDLTERNIIGGTSVFPSQGTGSNDLVVIGVDLLQGTIATITDSVLIGSGVMKETDSGTPVGLVGLGFGVFGANVTTSTAPGDYSIGIGHSAGVNAKHASGIYIGQNAGLSASSGSTGDGVIAIGKDALRSMSGAITDTIAMGERAGYLLYGTSNNNIIIGDFAASSTGGSSSQNVVLGADSALHWQLGSGNLFLGYGAGPTVNAVINNEMYINNIESDTPLIHGYFDAHASGPALTINGSLTLGGGLDTSGNDITVGGTGQILLNNGSVTDPAIAFSSNVDAGMWYTTSILRCSIDGLANSWSLASGDFLSGSNTKFTCGTNGAEGAPGFRFQNGGGAGMFLINSSELAFSAGGTEMLRLNATAGEAKITGDMQLTKHFYFDAEVANTTAVAINWTNGNKQSIAPTAAGNPTYTFTVPDGPTNLTLKATNLGAAGTVTWPATVKWPGGTQPTWTSSGTDIISFYYDGTNFYGAAGLNYS